MFIKYFKSSYLPQYIALAVITMLIWGYELVYPQVFMGNNYLEPAYNLSVILFTDNKWVLAFAGILILYIQAIFLNKVLVDNDIVPKNSLIPAFVFLVISSASTQYLTYSPLSFAILFLIISIERLFKCYGNTKSYYEILSASLSISLASLFFFPSITFLILIYVMLISFSLTNWRLWIIPIIGILLPYLYVLVYYFLTDQFVENFESFELYWASLDVNALNPLIIKHLGHGIVLILFFIAALYYISHIQEKNIIIRKKMVLVVFLFLISILLSIFNFGTFDFLFIIFALPLSVFISFYLGDIKIRMFHEYFMYLIILVIVLINYHLL